MHVDDLARAVLYSVENSLPESLYNVGSGEEISIKDLALLIQQIVGHQGEIIWDNTKPDGTPRKLMDSKKLTSMGWKVKIDLKLGIYKTYNDFIE